MLQAMNKYLVLSLLITGLISGCGGGNNDQGTGTLSVSITDAPVDNAEAVVIHFTSVTVHNSNGDSTDIPVTNPLTNQPGASIDLLQLTGNKSVVLFDDELKAGSYSWMRLDVDFDPAKTYIQIAGNQYALKCTSCENNGLKLNRSFTIDADQTTAFTLDFDLRKSITDPQSGNDYRLRPTIRVIEASAAGSISGTVDSALISGLGGDAGCTVYVYDGHNIVPDDIYLPANTNPPGDYANPLTSASVVFDADSSRYLYTAAFLPAGDYTVSLTCDGEFDDPEAEDTIQFSATTNTNVLAGQTTTEDFNP